MLSRRTLVAVGGSSYAIAGDALFMLIFNLPSFAYHSTNVQYTNLTHANDRSQQQERPSREGV